MFANIIDFFIQIVRISTYMFLINLKLFSANNSLSNKNSYNIVT